MQMHERQERNDQEFYNIIPMTLCGTRARGDNIILVRVMGEPSCGEGCSP